MRLMAGVPQGSVLGSVAYDGVLRMSLPESVRTVALAEDLATLLTSATKKRLVRDETYCWMAQQRLELTVEKKLSFSRKIENSKQ